MNQLVENPLVEFWMEKRYQKQSHQTPSKVKKDSNDFQSLDGFNKAVNIGSVSAMRFFLAKMKDEGCLHSDELVLVVKKLAEKAFSNK